MRQRTLALISGLTVLGAVDTLQVLRILDTAEGGQVAVQLGLLAGFIAILFALVFGVPEVVSRVRWRDAAGLAPPGSHLLLLGDYQSEELVIRGIAVYVSHDRLIIQTTKGAHPVRAVGLHEVERAWVEQIDSPLYWGTELKIAFRDQPEWSIAAEGWRTRSRRRLELIASRAVTKMVSESSASG